MYWITKLKAPLEKHAVLVHVVANFALPAVEITFGEFYSPPRSRIGVSDKHIEAAKALSDHSVLIVHPRWQKVAV